MGRCFNTSEQNVDMREILIECSMGIFLGSIFMGFTRLPALRKPEKGRRFRVVPLFLRFARFAAIHVALRMFAAVGGLALSWHLRTGIGAMLRDFAVLLLRGLKLFHHFQRLFRRFGGELADLKIES